MSSPSDLLFIRDGLSLRAAQARYAQRRRDLVSKTGVPCLIFSVDRLPGVPNSWVHFNTSVYQDPYFLFLTGLTQSPAAVFIHPSGQDTLFLPPRNPKKEFWDGIAFGSGDDFSVNGTGFSRILPLDCLTETLLPHLKDTPQLGLIWHEDASKKILKDSHYYQNADLLPRLPKTLSHRSICPEFWPIRLKLDKTDLANFKRATQITHLAFTEFLAHLPECRFEYEASGFLEGQILQRSPYGLSFPTIMASGDQACVLHYTRNDHKLDPHRLLLIDFGARWQTMHADISRTVSPTGQKTPLQQLIYDIVLLTQQHVESQVKAGISIDTLNTICWDFMSEQLQEKIIKQGGTASLPYDKQPHNVGHLLGRQVHDGDPYRDYRSWPLQADWVITNEPGLYGEFELKIGGIVYHEKIGIRLEDNLLVTEKGCTNLSAAIPK